MGRATVSFGCAVLLAAAGALFGCSEGGEHHDQNIGGVMHAQGASDPLRRCNSCHGDDLRGGRGPSCYSCHDNADHTAVRGGVTHRPGATSACPSCHGPGGSGGLGPSCYRCHTSYPQL